MKKCANFIYGKCRYNFKTCRNCAFYSALRNGKRTEQNILKSFDFDAITPNNSVVYGCQAEEYAEALMKASILFFNEARE